MSLALYYTTSDNLGSVNYNSTVSIDIVAKGPLAIQPTTVTYKIVSGSLPTGLSLTNNTVLNTSTIVGTTVDNNVDDTSTFTIRATDNFGNIRDKTFTLTVSGSYTPQFTTTIDNSDSTKINSLITTLDKALLNIPITYTNPRNDSTLALSLVSGSLPPNIELSVGISGSTTALIYGYTLTETLITLPATYAQQTYSFTLKLSSTNYPLLSVTQQYSITVVSGVSQLITWTVDSDLGTVYNNTISHLFINAAHNTTVEYSVGTLPPQLTLQSNGLLVGTISHQLTDTRVETTPTYIPSTTFSFTVKAQSSTHPNDYPAATRTFTVTVESIFNDVTETVYIRCDPNMNDREMINDLLTNTSIIPPNMIYRNTDSNFGVASSISYNHAYGIKSSKLSEYVAAIEKNHYHRQITLGPLKTAVARDNLNNIIYEVVYSEIIDDLVNSKGTSISDSIALKKSLLVGGYYTNSIEVFSSYGYDMTLSDTNLIYFTSLTPQYIEKVYPNSLTNMRNQLASTLNTNLTVASYNNSKLLPKFMTSVQTNGTVLGFKPLWVICYTLPGYSNTILNNINTMWGHKLNEINFKVDRITVDKSHSSSYELRYTSPSYIDLPTQQRDNSLDFDVLFTHETSIETMTSKNSR